MSRWGNQTFVATCLGRIEFSAFDADHLLFMYIELREER